MVWDESGMILLCEYALLTISDGLRFQILTVLPFCGLCGCAGRLYSTVMNNTGSTLFCSLGSFHTDIASIWYVVAVAVPVSRV